MSGWGDSFLSGILKAAACGLSAIAATYAICGLADVFHWVSNPYDPSGMQIMAGIAFGLGLLGVHLRRIGFVAVIGSALALGYCIWTISLGRQDDWTVFVPVFGCLAGFPLVNAVLLRAVLFALVPDYGHPREAEASSEFGNAFASRPLLGGWAGPAGMRAPMPPIASPSSSSKSNEDQDEDGIIGNQA